jgi:hypothetical protein
LSKKVGDTISGKNDPTSSKNDANKDTGSDVGASENGHGKGIYSNMSFDYGQLIKGSSLHAPSVNIGKPPHFDGTRYIDWSYKMKMHLIAARLWEVVEVGVIFPTDEDREITPEEVHNLYQNEEFCYGCGQVGHFIADCPNEKKKHKHDKDEDKKNKGKKRAKVHLGEEWESSDSSDDEKKKKKGATNIAIHHSSPTMIFPDSTSPPKLFPNLPSSPRLFSNLIDNDYYTPTCLMAKGEKVHNSSDSSNDEYDSCDENIEELEATMIKKFGKKAYTKIKTLMKKLKKRDRCLEMQGDIITQERDKNLALKASIAEEKMKVEKLTV